jgi:hypothetical protein
MRCLLPLIGLIAASASPAAPRSTELRGSGPWKVDYAEAACLLTRAYAEPNGTIYDVELTFEPTSVEVWLRLRSSAKTSKRDSGDTVVEMDGTKIADNVHFNVFSNPTGGTTREFWLRDINKIAPMRRSLRLTTKKHGDFTLAADNFAGAASAVARCMDDLHRSLGIDPAVFKKIATPPYGDEPFQFVAYPPGGLDISLLYWVTENGRVEDCRVLKRSGDEKLDKSICPRFELKGRVYPARDAAGKPIRAPVYDNIRLRREIL